MRRFGAIGLFGLTAVTCCATAHAGDSANPLAIKPWHSTSELGYAAPETETRNITRFMEQAVNEVPPLMPDPEITGPTTSTASRPAPAPRGDNVASAVAAPTIVTIVPPPRPAFTSTQGMTIPDPMPGISDPGNPNSGKPDARKPARKVARLTESDAGKLRLPVPIVIGAFR